MTVEQASIESIFHEMGYTSSTDYAIKKVREELLNELKVSLGVSKRLKKNMA